MLKWSSFSVKEYGLQWNWDLKSLFFLYALFFTSSSLVLERMDWDEDNEDGDFRRFFGGVNPDKLDIVRLENDPEKILQHCITNISDQVSISRILYAQLLRTKFNVHLFWTWSLALYLFGARKLAEKLLLECWWNLPQRRILCSKVSTLFLTH